ncbi:hypothetical protein FQN54_008333 [Arachnomyces sp. PD_36]|nr:hypothetical protein FQN54_008333 [Arachnomyces sp. PD_36]
MHYITLSILLQSVLFLSGSVSEELNAEDVPKACSTICQPIVELTAICDIDPNESEDEEDGGEGGEDEGGVEPDEPIENNCFCTNKSFDVESIAGLCASCIEQTGQENGDDMSKLMSACSFSSTSYAPSATALVAQVTVSATKPSASGTPGASSTPPASQGEGTAAGEGFGTRMDVPGILVFGAVCLGLVNNLGAH